jgi:hypothetical protein
VALDERLERCQIAPARSLDERAIRIGLLEDDVLILVVVVGPLRAWSRPAPSRTARRRGKLANP